ncbi:hypothetical protein FRC03_002164 [Tulasnella sp. 419]|nr:hypothetical protein FRC03_002164 [Tulasnella sp. 419]
MDDDFDIPLSPSPPQVSNSAWSTALLEIDNVLATSVDDSRLLRFKLEEHDRLMITLSAKKSALVSLRSCNSSIPTPLFQELRDLTARLVKLHKSIFAHGSTEVSSSLALPLNTSGQSLYLPSTSSATIPLPEAAATRSPQSQSQAPPSPPPPVSPAVDIPSTNHSPAVVEATPSSSPVRQLSLRPSNSSLPARNTDSSHSHLEDHVLSSPPMSSHHPRRLGPQISKSSSLMEKARNVLQKDFRIQSFRSHQEVVIRRLLDDGLSAVAIIPTGNVVELPIFL